MEKIDGNKLRGHLESLVLSVLAGGDAHGLKILHALEEQGCGLLKMREGSLYPALFRLEENGMIKGYWEPESSERRRGARRRIYRITSKGKRKLKSSRTEWKKFVSVIGNILEAGS